MTKVVMTALPTCVAIAKTAAFTLIAVALMFAVAWTYRQYNTNSVKIVDFDDTIAENGSVSTTSTDPRPVLRVAVAAMISPQITKHYYEDLLRTIGDYVGRRTLLVQRKTYAEVNDLLEQKEIDVAFVCSGPYVVGHRQFGMEILGVPVVDGGKVYHSCILVKRDSPITRLDDLKGKSFVFTDPKSNTGFLVPRYMLFQRGYRPNDFFGETSFTYSHDNSIRAVAEGVADGAAVDNFIWKFMNASDPTYTSQTKIIEESPPYGMPPVVVHPELDSDLKNRLRETLLSLHKKPAAARILERFRIERFEAGDDAMYDSVREMEEWQRNYEQKQARLP